MPPQVVQVLKFVLVFAMLVAINRWLMTNQRAVFIEDGKNVDQWRVKAWFILALLSEMGVLNFLGYAMVANQTLFNTLKMPPIIILTVLTALSSSALILTGRFIDYIDEHGIAYPLYPVIVSVGAVLTRFFWLRGKGKLGAAEE